MEATSLRYLSVEKIHFLKFATVFKVYSNNADMSKYSFRDIQTETVTLFLDTVSYVLSRSTLVSFDKCIFQYNTVQVCKAYTDKLVFRDCWISTNDQSTISIYANSSITIDSCMFIPAGVGSDGRAFVKLTEDNGAGGTTRDTHRDVRISNCRISNEGGNPPLLVSDYSSSNDIFSSIGITIDGCSITGYTPSTYKAANSENGLVYLDAYPTSIKFSNCNFYTLTSKLVAKDDSLSITAPDSFIIDLDEATLNNAARTIGEVSTYDFGSLGQFINNPDTYTFRDIEEDGNLKMYATATTGQQKATFTVRTGWTDADYREPTSFLLLLSGAGSTATNDTGYGGSSLYIVTVAGYYSGGHKSKITTTKLSGDTFGLYSGSTADIISAHFGTADTGSASEARATEHVITIAFGLNAIKLKGRIIGLSKKISRYFLR